MACLTRPCAGDPGDCFNWLYAEQKTVQTLFILIAVVAVPWLLLTEPCLIKCELDAERKRKEEEGTASLHANATEGEHGHDDEEEVGLGKHSPTSACLSLQLTTPLRAHP